MPPERPLSLSLRDLSDRLAPVDHLRRWDLPGQFRPAAPADPVDPSGLSLPLLLPDPSGPSDLSLPALLPDPSGPSVPSGLSLPVLRQIPETPVDLSVLQDPGIPEGLSDPAVPGSSRFRVSSHIPSRFRNFRHSRLFCFLRSHLFHLRHSPAFRPSGLFRLGRSNSSHPSVLSHLRPGSSLLCSPRSPRNHIHNYA